MLGLSPDAICIAWVQVAAAKQKSIASELDKTTGEVLKKLEDIRNKIL